MIRAYALSVLLAVLTLFHGTASAERVARKTVELGVSGSYYNANLTLDGEDEVSGDDLTLATNVGYFLSPVIELTGGILYQHETTDRPNTRSSSSHTIQLIPSLVLNLPTEGRFLPYVKVGGGFQFYGGDSWGSETSFIFPNLAGGLRTFVTRSVSINVEIGYHHQKDIGGEKGLNANAFDVSLGLSAFLGR